MLGRRSSLLRSEVSGQDGWSETVVTSGLVVSAECFQDEALISETRNTAWVSTPRNKQQCGAHIKCIILIFNKHEAKRNSGALMSANIKAKSMNLCRCANFLQTLAEVRLMIRQACDPRSPQTKLSAWCCEPPRAEELLAESV